MTDTCPLPDCSQPAGHISETPCGHLHIPGSPCAYCGKPTPLTGDACPDCWISLTDKPMADIKGLLALAGLSVDPVPRNEGRP
jgi:hypothetical protein